MAYGAEAIDFELEENGHHYCLLCLQSLSLRQRRVNQSELNVGVDASIGSRAIGRCGSRKMIVASEPKLLVVIVLVLNEVVFVLDKKGWDPGASGTRTSTVRSSGLSTASQCKGPRNYRWD
jgi:hypothetical protein